MTRYTIPALIAATALLLSGCSGGDTSPEAATGGPAAGASGSAPAQQTWDIGYKTTVAFTPPEGYTVAGQPEDAVLILTADGTTREQAAQWITDAAGDGGNPEGGAPIDFIALAAMPCTMTVSPEDSSKISVTNGWRIGSTASSGVSTVAALHYNQSTSGDSCLAAVVNGFKSPGDTPAIMGAVESLVKSATVVFPAQTA